MREIKELSPGEKLGVGLLADCDAEGEMVLRVGENQGALLVLSLERMEKLRELISLARDGIWLGATGLEAGKAEAVVEAWQAVLDSWERGPMVAREGAKA